eukprot:7732588-Karenia_brevis.AAC.1
MENLLWALFDRPAPAQGASTYGRGNKLSESKCPTGAARVGHESKGPQEKCCRSSAGSLLHGTDDRTPPRSPK